MQILNYTVASNHVHLLVKDNAAPNTIPSAIQLGLAAPARTITSGNGARVLSAIVFNKTWLLSPT